MDKDEIGVIGLVVLGIVGYVVGAVLWAGFVVSVLWGWFAVPILSLPVITIGQAIALRLLYGAFVGIPLDTKKFDEAPWIPLVKVFIAPAVALLVGWIVTLFL